MHGAAALVTTLVATLLVVKTASATTNATVRLASEKLSYDATEPVVVRVTITNSSDHPIRILRWYTPRDGVERSLFTVRRDGDPLSYRGRMVKRAAPTSTDYVPLLPGETLATDVALSPLYDLTTPGRYEIAYDAASPELYANDEATAGTLRSEPLWLTVTAPASRPH